jgi:type III pantothenate kinase
MRALAPIPVANTRIFGELCAHFLDNGPGLREQHPRFTAIPRGKTEGLVGMEAEPAAKERADGPDMRADDDATFEMPERLPGVHDACCGFGPTLACGGASVRVVVPVGRYGRPIGRTQLRPRTPLPLPHVLLAQARNQLRPETEMRRELGTAGKIAGQQPIRRAEFGEEALGDGCGLGATGGAERYVGLAAAHSFGAALHFPMPKQVHPRDAEAGDDAQGGGVVHADGIFCGGARGLAVDMVLTVDVGNTKTAIATWVGGRALDVRQAPTHEARDWLAWVREGEVAPRRLVLASVVPAMVERWRAVAVALSVPCQVLTGIDSGGLSVAVEDPAAVGPDRLANALGALEHGPGAWVTVGFGTATIVDLVLPDGRFLGGAIAPGAMTALRALTAQTARLPEVPLVAPRCAVGRSTVEAMQSGALLGHAAMVDGLVARMEAEVGVAVSCVATGGLAGVLAPSCRRVNAIDPLLTLRGLRRASEPQ